jgi:hypothetical protein
MKAGFSVGWVSALDAEGRTLWIADAHRERKRFVVRADEKPTAFLELESATRDCGKLACQADEIFGKTCRDQDLNPGRGASPEQLLSLVQI